jgi:hypothetical protein
VSSILGFEAHTGSRLAEIGFLLILIAGLWLLSAEFAWFGRTKMRRGVAGLALAIAGVLLIVATRWGHFG